MLLLLKQLENTQRVSAITFSANLGTPRNLQLPMAVLENENVWLGGWVNGLMVAVLLDLQEVARS